MRKLLKDTDGDGMTFLMHGASGATNNHANADRTAAENQLQAPSQAQRQRFKSSSDYGLDSSYNSYNSTRQLHPSSRLQDVSEESKLDIEAARSPRAGQGGGGGATPAAPDDPLSDSAGRGAPNGARSTYAASQAHKGGDEVDDPTVALLRRKKGMMYPSLVVFKTVWSVVEDSLWKEQVRDPCYDTIRWQTS